MRRVILFLLLLSVCIFTENLDIEKWERFPNIRTVAFSPDSQLMAIAHENNYISLHNFVTNSEVATLKGHFHYITALCFSSDSSLLASGGEDLLIKIWSTGNGVDLHTLSGHSAMITCLAFSPNKKLIASGSGDKTIKIWSLTTGKLLKTLEEHKVGITELAFSGDSSLLYSKSNVVKIWKVSVNDSSSLVEEVKNAGYYYIQGLKAKENGNLNEAIRNLEISATMDPKQIDAHFLLACCYSARSQYHDSSPIGQGKKEEDLKKSYSYLNNSIQNGYQNWEKIKTEKDLDFVRLTKDYERIAIKINVEDTNQETSSTHRRISFYVKDVYDEAVAADEIYINGNKITEEDEFAVDKDYDVVLKFQQYETWESKIKIRPGMGPFVINAPIRKLGEYTFSISGTSTEIDEIVYPYEIIVDSKPVEKHHIKISPGRVYADYTIYIPNTSSNIQIVAGYQVVQKRLYQIKGKSVRRFDQISIPLLIKHMETIAERGSGPIDAVYALEKLFKSVYWRQILKNVPVGDLLTLFEVVEGWDLFNENHQLRRELLLGTINELIDSK